MCVRVREPCQIFYFGFEADFAAGDLHWVRVPLNPFGTLNRIKHVASSIGMFWEMLMSRLKTRLAVMSDKPLPPASSNEHPTCNNKHALEFCCGSLFLGVAGARPFVGEVSCLYVSGGHGHGAYGAILGGCLQPLQAQAVAKGCCSCSGKKTSPL